MFGSIGVPEIILIFVVALLLFGPRKLPDIGRSLGRALGEFRRASNDLKRTLEEEVASDQLREVGREVRSAVSNPLSDTAAKPPDESASGAPQGEGGSEAVPGDGSTRDSEARATREPDGTPLEPR